MGLRVERSLLLRFAFVLALAVAATAANHLGLRRAVEDGGWVAHTHEVLEKIEATASLLKDAESGQRGYLLTGRPEYLVPSEEAIGTIARQVDALAALTVDNPAQQARIARMAGLVGPRLALLGQTIALRRDEGPEAALALFNTGRGKRLMDEIRGVIAAMKAEEYRLLEIRSGRAVAAQRIVLVLAWAGSAAALLVLGLAYRMVVWELTQRRAAEAELYDSEAKFQAFADCNPALLFIKDEAGRILYVNRPTEELFRVRLDDIRGKRLSDWLPQGATRASSDNDAAALADDRPLRVEESLPTPEGEHRTWLVDRFPIRDSLGRRMLGGVAIDVTEQKRLEAELDAQLRRVSSLNARLAELATSDPLTGLKNRRAYREALDRHFGLAVRSGEPLSVVMLDVDHFKAFNDAYGHPAGDEVLRAVASVLRDTARSTDVVARYGGEEFVVLLPGTDAEGGREVAGRLRAAVERHPWRLRPVTASFGVATVAADTPDAGRLVEEADEALYLSKRRGRNRVTHVADAAGVPADA